VAGGWQDRAEAWIRWARDPELDDDFWVWHLEAFLALLPPPGRLTVDVACGEGRLPRVLVDRGHVVVGVDRSASMVVAARQRGTQAVVADAAELPFATGSADLVLHFCCLHDLDDLIGAVTDAARVLRPGGVLCQALLQPVRTARAVHRYAGQERYAVQVGGPDATFTYHGVHRPIAAYMTALLEAGLQVDAVREVFDPRAAGPGATGFLHLRAVHP